MILYLEMRDFQVQYLEGNLMFIEALGGTRASVFLIAFGESLGKFE